MSDTTTPGQGTRRRWWRVVLSLLVLVAAGVWLVRAAMWPCGALDRTSGCVSSVTLDVAALGLDPGKTSVEYLGFDLGPDGDVALVGLKMPTEAGWRTVLAVFDARTGQPLRMLAEASGMAVEPFIGQVALSSDGSLAAAILSSEIDGVAQTELNVYRVADGSLVRTVWSAQGNERDDCTSLMDFSPDGRTLQCYTQLQDLASGAIEPIGGVDGGSPYPGFASFASVIDPVAPDGTSASLSALEPGLDLFDSIRWGSFAPDSTGLLVLSRAHPTNRGQRLYTPSVFRRMAAVEIRDGKTGQFQRGFLANRRYLYAAWSQDAALFGLISGDLRLDIFRR